MSKSIYFKPFLLVTVALTVVGCTTAPKAVAVTAAEPDAVDEVARNRASLATEKAGIYENST